MNFCSISNAFNCQISANVMLVSMEVWAVLLFARMNCAAYTTLHCIRAMSRSRVISRQFEIVLLLCKHILDAINGCHEECTLLKSFRWKIWFVSLLPNPKVTAVLLLLPPSHKSTIRAIVLFTFVNISCGIILSSGR